MSLEEVEAFLIKKALVAFRWKCAQGGGSARAEPERVLSAAAAVWAVDFVGRSPRRPVRGASRESFPS